MHRDCFRCCGVHLGRHYEYLFLSKSVAVAFLPMKIGKPRRYALESNLPRPTVNILNIFHALRDSPNTSGNTRIQCAKSKHHSPHTKSTPMQFPPPCCSYVPHMSLFGYQWNYENRFGTSSGRFKIDLYLAEGLGGDCGQWVSSICNKPDIGCMDTGAVVFV